MNDVHFSSRTDNWGTPVCLFAELDREFRFTRDACASTANAKCALYYTLEEDGLRQDWRGTIFCNPPYGRRIGLWVAKAFESTRHDTTTVMVLPARPDTKWWFRYVSRASEVRFLRGRVRFEGGEHPAPFPSVVVVFRPGDADRDEVPARWACYGPATLQADTDDASTVSRTPPARRSRSRR